MDASLTLATAVLAAARGLVERIHSDVTAAGFTDLRPAHGFAFARIAGGGTTATELAHHLGVTRQAAGQLLDELEAKGYVTRRPHPSDGRARIVVLTERGWACTRAADAAAARALAGWVDDLGPQRTDDLVASLHRLGDGGPVRPVW